MLEWMNWKADQWKRWDSTQVSIPLDLFDDLTNALELLHQGARLSKPEKNMWKARLDACQTIRDQEIHKITIGG